MSEFSEGKHKRDAGGKFTSGGGGGGESHAAPTLEQKRQSVRDAMTRLAQGSKEETLPNLRNDLEQHGGTNDVTLLTGDKKKGLEHIAKRHGAEVIPGVLEAVMDGEMLRYIPSNQTVVLKKGNYEAVLSLNEHGKKKTWLLTGFDVTVAKDAADGGGKFSPRHAPTQCGPMFSRPALGADASFMENLAMLLRKVNVTTPIVQGIAFDVASKRHKDENGFLHVELNPISKECVNPYYGREVTGWQALGLDPDRVYHALRAGEELARAAHTFHGLPLLLGHHVESAENPQKEHRVGSLGTDAVFESPYLRASLIITDASAIQAIESGEAREISAGYAFEPEMTAGTWNGQEYDFIMKNIRGNHVALVGEGRAGPDVAVADSVNKRGMIMQGLNKAVAWARRVVAAKVADEAPAQPPEQAEVEAAREILAAHEGADVNTDADPRVDKILAMFPDLEPDKATALLAALQELAATATAGDEDPEAEKAAKAEDEDPEAEKAEDEDPEAEKAAKAEDEDLEAEKACDAALRRKSGRAWDSVAMRAMAGDAAMARMRALSAAARDVRPLVGEILDPLAFDSAADIYGKALELAGVRKHLYPRTAWRGMCDVLLQQRTGGTGSPGASHSMAADSKRPDNPCKYLGNIRLEG